jgi:hypothetical protein
MNLGDTLKRFSEERGKLIELARSLGGTFWTREADHTEYTPFTPLVMLPLFSRPMAPPRLSFRGETLPKGSC